MKSQSRLALLGLALGVLFALVIAPQTRWLVRLQTLTALRLYHPFPQRLGYTSSLAGDKRRYEEVAARHPEDYAIQYAAAVSTDDSNGQALTRLRALTARFPDRPALYANLLRYETLGNIHLNRPEENLLTRLPVSRRRPQEHRNAPADLADYDQAAAAGERLDPGNAYFPLMRAVGLFAAFRDAEGLAAFQRASERLRWQEYCADDVEARWRLHEEAFGDPGALGRVAISASLLLPQFAQLRALARLILVRAIQQEQAGHREEGLRLREALQRCGSLMRVQSTDVIESLVAIAICEIATDRIEGLTPPKAAPALGTDERRRLRLDTYGAYVTRLGHPEAAVQARAEDAAGQQVSALVGLDDFARFLTPLTRLGQWWKADLAVLSNILWLLLLGGLAGGVTWLGGMRRTGERPARMPDWRRWSRLWAAGLLLLGGAGFAGLWHLALWQSGGLGEIADALRSLSGQSGGDGSGSDDENARQSAQWLSLAASLAVPLLLALALVIAALVRRAPVPAGLVRGVRAAALPAACGLLLVWGLLLLGTVRQERVVSAQAWHQVHDEGPYLAAQAGRAWPGPVR